MPQFEQRTVIVRTDAVDGVVRLNKAMGQALVAREGVISDGGDAVSVLLFEGDLESLDYDRFYVVSVAQDAWDATRFYDCDGYYYSIRSRENLRDAVARQRGYRRAHGEVSMDDLAAKHAAAAADQPAAAPDEIEF